MPATVRFYEVVYIIAPDRTEEQVQAVIAKYNNLITTQGGTVERTDIWERRRLAYEIKGYTEGLYVVMTFKGLPPVEAELKRVFRISEDTIRSIVVRPDEETVPFEPAPYGGRFQRTNAPSPYVADRPADAAPAASAPAAAVAEAPAAEAAATPSAPEPEAAAPVAEAETAEAPVAEAAPVEAEAEPALATA